FRPARLETIALRLLIALILATFAAALWSSPPALAQSGESLAVLAASQGEVFRLNPESGEWEPIPSGAELFLHDRIRTGPGSGAALLFRDGSEIKLHENSTLEITDRPAPEEPRGVAARLRLFVGGMFGRVNPQESSLEFETPDAVATVRGTEFGIRTRPLGSMPSVDELGLLFELFKERFPTESVWALLEGLLAIAAMV